MSLGGTPSRMRSAALAAQRPCSSGLFTTPIRLTAVSLIGVVKSPEEQGRWTAHAALRILEGVPPSDIPLSYNREGELFFNARIARKFGIKDPPPLARAVP